MAGVPRRSVDESPECRPPRNQTERGGPLNRLVERAHVDEVKAAYQFLRLGKGPVHHMLRSGDLWPGRTSRSDGLAVSAHPAARQARAPARAHLPFSGARAGTDENAFARDPRARRRTLFRIGHVAVPAKGHAGLIFGHQRLRRQPDPRRRPTAQGLQRVRQRRRAQEAIYFVVVVGAEVRDPPLRGVAL